MTHDPSHQAPLPETVTKAVRLADGARLQTVASGSGQPALLISGLSGAGAFWRDTIAQFKAGHWSIVFDQRGIGASTRGAAAVSIEQLASDALAVLDAWGIERAHLVGHSTGGCIAMAMALQHPERVQSLVLSATWAGPHAYMQSLFDARLALLQNDPAIYEAMGPFLTYSPDWLTANPGLLHTQTRGWSPEQVTIVAERIAALLAFDRRGQLDRLTQPCLVVGARDDLVVPLCLQVEIAQALPHAEREFFDNGGHFYPRTRSAKFASLLARFWDAHRLN